MADADAARIAELEAANAALSLRIVELEAFVALLLDKITVLERLVKGDSSNSSRPPSSDGATAKNKRPIANGRKLNKGAKRTQGKQPGAPGASLKPRAVPDLVVVHEPSCWRGCGAGLADAVTVGDTSRQVFDIANPTVYVSEHRALRRRCSCGSVTAGVFPGEATAPTCYGPNVKAYAIYLLCRQHVPQERCAEALSEMFGIDVSVATLNNWLTQAAATLDVFLASVRAGLAEAPVVHVDETPVRHGKRKAWFHVCSTRSLTLLWASATRGRIAVEAGLLPGYTGTAVHDRYALYFQYRCAHALCNAHLIRNLAGVGMVHSQKPWTDAMIDLLTETNNQVNTARAAGKTQLSTHHQRQITKRWNLCCAQALIANPDPPPRRTRSSYERDTRANSTACA